MLELKPYEQAQKDFEAFVTEKITSAQEKGISPVQFEALPSSIENELSFKLHYPIEHRNNTVIVSVL